MSEEYRKFDSDIDFEVRNVRLTDDANEISETFVKVKFVATSRREGDENMWFDAIPVDRDVPAAKFLKKGDVLSITGFPTMQRYGENKEKVGFTLLRARLHLPVSLLMELKERGYEPGAAGNGKAAGKGGKGKAAAKPSKPAARRQVAQLDDEDDDLPADE